MSTIRISARRAQLNALMRDHDGVITVAQVLDAGYSGAWARQQVARGQLRRLARGVFQSTTHTTTPRAALRAVVWGAGGVATGLTAAWWHGHCDLPDSWSVTVSQHRSGVAARGAIVHRRALAREDIEIVDGIAVSRIPLAILDAMGEGEPGLVLFDRLLARHVVRLSELEDTHQRYPRRATAAIAAEALLIAGDRTKSALERMFADLLRAAGITGWVAGFEVGLELDFAFPELRIAIELDGFGFHSDASAFDRDRSRQNRIQLHGWLVLRFTYRRIRYHRNDVVAEVLEAIALVEDSD